MNVCCGGIVAWRDGDDRAGCSIRSPPCLNIPKACRSICSCGSKGPLSDAAPALDPFDFVRTVAVARISCPVHGAPVRGPDGDVGRTSALCFLAGANSIFYGEKLLTTGNPDVDQDGGCSTAANPRGTKDGSETPDGDFAVPARHIDAPLGLIDPH